MEPQQPLFNEPFQSPLEQQVPAVIPPTPPEAKLPEPPSKKLMPLLLIGGALILVIVLVIIVIASGSKPKTKLKTAKNSVGQIQQSAPASSVGLQQTNDAISQDLSTLGSDDQSYPVDVLSDKSLGL